MRVAGLLLCVILAMLFPLQWSVASDLVELSPELVLLPWRPAVVLALSAVSCVGFCLAAGLVLALSGLLLVELRVRGLTRVLVAALRGEPAAGWVLLAAAALWALRPVWMPGIPESFDGKLHFATVAAVSDILGGGEWPAFTWRFYGGYAPLTFHGPLFYLTAGPAAVLFGAAGGIKVAFTLVVLGSGLVFRALARRLLRHEGAVVAATAVYLLSPARSYTLLVLGRMPESLLWVFFPLLLLAVERTVDAARRSAGTGSLLRHGALAGGAAALLFLAHPMVGGLGVLVGAVYAAVAVLSDPAARRRLPGLSAAALVAGAFALALSAWSLEPMIRLRPYVQIGHVYGEDPAGLLLPGPPSASALLSLVAWRLPLAPAGNVPYVGIGALLLGATGAFAWLRRRPGGAAGTVVILLLTLLLCGTTYFHTRCVLYFSAALSLVVGAVFARAPCARPPRLLVAALAVALLDLLPLHLTPPFRTDLDEVRRDFRALREQEPGVRFVHASLRRGKPETSQWLCGFDSGLPVVSGPFREAATKSYPLQMTLLARIGDELAATGGITEDTKKAMHLLGVGGIVLEDGHRVVGMPGHSQSGASPPRLVLDHPWPLLFARRIERAPEIERALSAAPRITDRPVAEKRAAWDSALLAAALESGVRADRPWATRILVASEVALPADAAGGPADLLTMSQVEVRLLVATDTRWVFRTATGEDLAVQIGCAQFPGVEILVDGRPQATLTSVTGFPVIRVPAGVHTIGVLAPGAPSPAWAWPWAAIIAALLIALPTAARLACSRRAT